METITHSRFESLIDNSVGLLLSSFFLFQVDITEDGLGYANFKSLKNLFKNMD